MSDFIFGLESQQIVRPRIPASHRALLRENWAASPDSGALVEILVHDLHLFSVLRLLNGDLKVGAQADLTREAAHALVEDLGPENSREAALGILLFRANRLGDSNEFHYDKFWTRALASGIASNRLAHLCGTQHSVRSFLSGLFATLGQVMLVQSDPEAYDALLQDTQSEKSLELREFEHFGVDRDTVAWATMRDLGLPREVFASMLEASRELRLAGRAMVQVGESARGQSYAAQLLGEVIAADSVVRRRLWGGFVELRKRLELTSEELNALSDTVVNDWWDWGELFSVPTQALPGFSELSDWNERGVKPIRFNATGGKPLVPRGSGGGLDILLVEDSKIVRMAIKRILAKAGHRVRLAEDGREALEMFRQAPPQVVLSDWEMPHMNGIELCRNLRRTELGKRAYFMLFTGENDEGKILEAYESGINDFVVKGSSRPILLARIGAARSFLKHWEMIDEDRRIIRTHCEHSRLLAARMKEDSLTDALTGLPNRRFAMGRLEEEWARSSRTGQPMSVVLLDIDLFKNVNDTHGHHAGDLVLQGTAKALRDAARIEESVCRIGGDEFLIICTDSKLKDAESCAERLRKAVENNQVSGVGLDQSVTVSLGSAVRCDSMANVEELLKSADEGVYGAKAAGRNQVVLTLTPDQQNSLNQRKAG